MQRFLNKVALITGAARGIGQGIALSLAEEGANVVINDLPPQPGTDVVDAQETADQITSMGREALPFYADVSNRQQVELMFQNAVEHFGHIDVVVANAALTIREPTLEADIEHVRRVVNVTQLGVYNTCQLAALQMVRQQASGRPGGKIVIIGSVLAEIPLLTSAPYNMAKAAVNQLGRTLANELAEHRINVNVVNPGWIDTPGEHKLATKEELAEGARRIPWGRLGLPRDIGRAVAYLASDDADYVTGSILAVDGGYRLGLRDLD